MILVQEFHVLDLRIKINMYDPRSFLALLRLESCNRFRSHPMKALVRSVQTLGL